MNCLAQPWYFFKKRSSHSSEPQQLHSCMSGISACQFQNSLELRFVPIGLASFFKFWGESKSSNLKSWWKLPLLCRQANSFGTLSWNSAAWPPLFLTYWFCSTCSSISRSLLWNLRCSENGDLPLKMVICLSCLQALFLLCQFHMNLYSTFMMSLTVSCLKTFHGKELI